MHRFKPDTLISEIIAEYPVAAAVLERRGLSCASCLAAGSETVYSAAAMHGVDVRQLLDALNGAIEVSHSKERSA